MRRRPERTIRAGTQKSSRRSVLAALLRRGSGAEVAAHRGRRERHQRGLKPDAVGALAAGGQVAQRLAELCLFEALVDLGSGAVEALDLLPRAPFARDVGEDEAVAEAVVGLAIDAELELLGVDRAAAPRGGAGELGAGEAHPADDQPQGFVAPALGHVARLGDLGAVYLERLAPGLVGDLREPLATSRSCAARTP